MKVTREPQTVLMIAFRVAAARVQINTDLTADEIKELLNTGDSTPIRINSVNDDPKVEDDFIIIRSADVLFYAITIPNKSDLIVPDSKLMKLQ